MRGWVRRLVNANFAAAGKQNTRIRSPRRLPNLGAFNFLGFQRFDETAQIVAHEVQNRPHQSLPNLALHKVSASGVNRQFRWRQRENQPTLAHIDRAKSEDVGDKPAIPFRIFAVEKKVGAINHGESLPQEIGIRRQHVQPKAARASLRKL